MPEDRLTYLGIRIRDARRNIFARNCPKSFLLFNGIANPPYRFNESGVSGGVVQLLPQPPDVGHDGVVLQVLLAPHRLKKLRELSDYSVLTPV